MSVALDAARLFALIVFGLAFLLGLGWLMAGPVLHGSLTTGGRDSRLLDEIPLAILGGLLLNYGLTLVFQSLPLALAVAGLAAILGLGCFAVHAFRLSRSHALSARSIEVAVGAAFVCLLFLSPILTEPLWAWDARSIWFFHAKMIYTAASIGPSAGWLHPSVTPFAHVFYPKLLPALAAQVATVMGFWNEYLPKASLFFMLVPAVLWLFSFVRRSVSFVVLLLLLTLGLSSWMWNGYMDGYLAMYFAIAMLLLERSMESRRAADMASVVCILLFLPNLKNEGALAAISGLILVVSLLLRKSGFKLASVAATGHWRLYLVGLAALLPALLWGVYRQQWGLPNDMVIASAQSIARVSDRLADGSLGLIFQRSWVELRGALMLLGLLFTACIAWNRALPKNGLLPLLAACAYFLGVVMTYLLTPYELVWHLTFSLLRVLLPVNACIFAASFMLMNRLEHEASADPPRRARRQPA